MADEKISLQQAASGGNLVFVVACACDRPGFIAGCDFVLSSAFGFGFVLEKPFFLLSPPLSILLYVFGGELLGLDLIQRELQVRFFFAFIKIGNRHSSSFQCTPYFR